MRRRTAAAPVGVVDPSPPGSSGAPAVTASKSSPAARASWMRPSDPDRRRAALGAQPPCIAESGMPWRMPRRPPAHCSADREGYGSRRASAVTPPAAHHRLPTLSLWPPRRAPRARGSRAPDRPSCHGGGGSSSIMARSSATRSCARRESAMRRSASSLSLRSSRPARSGRAARSTARRRGSRSVGSRSLPARSSRSATRAADSRDLTVPILMSARRRSRRATDRRELQHHHGAQLVRQPQEAPSRRRWRSRARICSSGEQSRWPRQARDTQALLEAGADLSRARRHPALV